MKPTPELVLNHAFAKIAMEMGPALPPGAGVYDPRGPIRELLAVAKGGAPTDASPAEMGARTVELVEGALRSARSGRVEPVPNGRPAWAQNAGR